MRAYERLTDRPMTWPIRYLYEALKDALFARPDGARCEDLGNK